MTTSGRPGAHAAVLLLLAMAASARADDDGREKLTPAQRREVDRLLRDAGEVKTRSDRDPTNRALREREAARAAGRVGPATTVPGADRTTVEASDVSRDVRDALQPRPGEDPKEFQRRVQEAERDPDRFAGQLPATSGARLREALQEIRTGAGTQDAGPAR